MRTCEVDGCEKKYYGNGFCSMHRERFLKYGNVHERKRPANGEVQDFLRKLPKDCEECITWPFGRGKGGYGSVYFKGKGMKPSRAVCFIYNGNPPTTEHEAAHSCGNGHKGCVNPNHLRWATSKENSADSILHGTISRGENHPASRVNESQARFMIESRGKIKQKDIAIFLGVPRSTVCQIQKGNSWKWLNALISEEREIQRLQPL